MTTDAPKDRRNAVDWGRIETWARQFVRGDLGQVNAVFEANGALPPRLLWQPTSSQVQTPQLRFLWDYWTKLKGNARLPTSRSVDLGALEPVSGYTALLDAIDDGRDFRYRRCGAVIAVLSGYDLTGKLVSGYSFGSVAVYLVETVVALHRAAYRRGEPLYVERAPLRGASGCHCLLLPLAYDADAVGGLLHGVVPIGAAGLSIGTTRF